MSNDKPWHVEAAEWLADPRASTFDTFNGDAVRDVVRATASKPREGE